MESIANLPRKKQQQPTTTTTTTRESIHRLTKDKLTSQRKIVGAEMFTA